MVDWGWLLIAVLGGATAGIVGIAIFIAGDTDEYDDLIHRIRTLSVENRKQRSMLSRWRAICARACEGSEDLAHEVTEMVGFVPDWTWEEDESQGDRNARQARK